MLTLKLEKSIHSMLNATADMRVEKALCFNCLTACRNTQYKKQSVLLHGTGELLPSTARVHYQQLSCVLQNFASMPISGQLQEELGTVKCFYNFCPSP